MRLDRFITLYVARPLLLLSAANPRSARASGRRLPILMYHSISDDPERGRSPYYRVCTSPKRFAEHMQWLADWGYRGVSLNDGLSWLKAPDQNSDVNDLRSGPLSDSQQTISNIEMCRFPSDPRRTSAISPPTSATVFGEQKLVALTFDDGYRDNLTAALPILRRHVFSATTYLPTAFIGEPGHRRQFNGRDCLTWDEVRELDGAGLEIGSHTVSHPRLVDLSWPQIESELCDSKSEIGARLGHETGTFAYPFAFPQAAAGFVSRFRNAVTKAGYHSCVTTAIGVARPSDDVHRLARHPANGADDRALLRAKLEGIYDWLGTVQTAFKRAHMITQRSSALQTVSNPTS